MSRLLAVAILTALGLFTTSPLAEGPRAIVSWPAGPLEVRVAFDRPIHAATASGLVGKTIPFRAQAGTNEAAPDPGSAPSGSLRIAAVKLEDDGRTLAIVTDPHPREATYTLTLNGLRAPDQPPPGASVSLKYDLSGVEVSWTEDGGGSPAWSAWWPHVDPEVVRARTAGSVVHERSLGFLTKPGRLGLRTLIALPEGKAVVHLASSGTIEEALLNFEAGTIADDGHKATFALESSGEPVELDLAIRTGNSGKPWTLQATYQNGDDPTEQPLSSRQFTVPWAPAPPPSPAATASPPPMLAGGDAERGKAVFFGMESRCSACHTFRGEGSAIGPDLSDIGQRDPATIYRDIAEPSATINPDYVTFTVVLKDGRVLSGVVRAEDAENVRVLDTNAQETRVKRSEIEELRPSATSIMPVGLAGALGEQSMKDLLAFLTAGAE